MGWDDYVCIVATSSMVRVGLYEVLALKADRRLVFQRGMGVHQWDLPLAKLNQTTLEGILYGVVIVDKPVLFLTKLALLLLHLRLFAPDRNIRYAIYFGIVFNFLFYLTIFFVLVFICPVMSPEYAECSNDLKVLAVAMSGFGIISDFYILLIPLLSVSRLQLRIGKKLGLIAVFLTGLLACIAGIINSVFRIRLDQSEDITWNMAPVLLLGVLEIDIGVIVGCMPTLPAFFQEATVTTRKYFPYLSSQF
ncbi:hypothetical protein MMC11_000904 [Xylographa trunciseda]|nr:hypothetical protein [Xylographa trunciseda]